MNLLLDPLPNEVNIEGVMYEINTDYRTSILFELAMQDSELSPEDKIDLAFELYYPVFPNNIRAGIEAILYFYSGNDETREKGPKETEETREEAIYSYEYDHAYIYSAYLTQYGIDLQDIDYLHWWKFKAMFRSLNSSNKIVEIMQIRGAKVSKDMSKEERKEMRRLKALYKLPDNRSEEEKQSEFSSELSSMF